MNLSIIITVYNKAKYIKKCLNSCLHQQDVKPDDYELIVVNDGSTDNSLEYVKEYANQYDNIRVIDQANAGLSMARNSGVDAARGDYVWFVDADDCVSDNAVKQIDDASESNPDIIPICARTEGEDVVRNNIPIEVKSGKEVLLCGRWTHCSPFYIYRRVFLLKNNLKFFPGIYHEDSELTPRLLFYAQSVVVIDKVLYTVYRDPHSITQVPKPKRAYDCVLVSKHLSLFSKQFIKEDDVRKVFDYNISVLINNALNIIIRSDVAEIEKFNLYLFENKEVFGSLFKSQLKYKIEFVLFQMFPKNYVQVYKLMKSRFG